MSSIANFRQLSLLLLVVEKLATTQRLRTLHFCNSFGASVGDISLDGGLVISGLRFEQAVYIDEEFKRDAAQVAAPLTKLLRGETLSADEIGRIQAVSLVARRALGQLMARALRRIAAGADLTQIRIEDHPPGWAAQARALRFAFPPVELLLAAGRSGRRRETDKATLLFDMPPEPVEERWLFEWQPDNEGEAWPIMTSRQADKKTNTVAQFGFLGQSLVQRFGHTRRSGESIGVTAELAVTELHLYYVVLTDRYVTLLVYQAQHIDRVLRSLHDVVFDAPLVQRPQRPAPHSVPAPATTAAPVEGAPATSGSAIPAPAVPALVPPPSAPPPATAAVAPIQPAAVAPVQPAAVAPVQPAAVLAAPVETQSGQAAPGPAGAMPAVPVEPLPISAAVETAVPTAVAAPPLPQRMGSAAAPTASAPTQPTPELLASPALPASPEDRIQATGSTPTPRLDAVAAGTAAVGSPGEGIPGPIALAIADAIPVAVLSIESQPIRVVVSPPPEAQRPLPEASAATTVTTDPDLSAPRSPTPSPDARTGSESPGIAEAPPSAVPILIAGPVPISGPSPVSGPPSQPAIYAALLSAEESLAQPRESLHLPAPTPARPALGDAAQSTLSAKAESAGPSPLPSMLLRLQGVCVDIAGSRVLDALDLTLGPRGLHALVGPHGAGKTVLLGVLGCCPPAEARWDVLGTLLYGGAPLTAANHPAVLAGPVARSTQSLRSYLLAGLDASTARGPVDASLHDVLDRARLSPFHRYLDDPLEGRTLRLFKAEWLRLALARQLLSNPALICFDDPTAGLSISDQDVLWSILREEAKQRAVLVLLRDPVEAGYNGAEIHVLSKPPAVHPLPTLRGVASAPTAPANATPDAPASGDSAAPRSASAPPPSPDTSGVIWPTALPILRLRDFSISVSGRTVLSQVNLDLADCGLHLLVGPENSLRRTFVRALCGPRGSQITIDGQFNFGGASLSKERGLAIPSTDPRHALSTVREYLSERPQHLNGAPRQESTRLVTELLHAAQFPEISKRLDVAFCELEPYERRVIEILALAASQPLAMVLQDVLHGLDPAIRPRLLALLAAQAAQHAILLCTDDPQPYLDFPFSPPLRIAYFGDSEILASPPPSAEAAGSAAQPPNKPRSTS